MHFRNSIFHLSSALNTDCAGVVVCHFDSKENESVIDSLFILYILIKEQCLHRLYTRRSTISGEILGYNIAEKYSINSSHISPHLLIYLVHIWNHNYLGFFPSILPLKLECMLITPNLPSNMENWFELSGFVKISAG
jgi:hypothetical protein